MAQDAYHPPKLTVSPATPMRILFLSHYFPPEGNAPATRVAALTSRWAVAGHEVTVITGVPSVPDGVVYPGYRNRWLPQEECHGGVRVIRVWTWLAPNKGTVRRILNYLSFMVSASLRAIFLRRPDVLIATSPQFFCGWAGVLCHWIYRLRTPFSKRTRFFLEIRDIWPESIGAVGAMSEGRLFVLLEWLEKRMYAAADHIVTVGVGYRRRLMERGVHADRISIVMNGVDRDLLETVTQDPEVTRREWGLDGKFVCSYIGTIGMASGLDIFLRAARLLRDIGRNDIRLLAVGDGAIRADLQAVAEREKLENVIFTGRRPKAEMPMFLAATDLCFVHLRKTPLFETVIPSKIFEALGMRRAILIGVDGDSRKLVEDSGGGVAIPPEDEHALVDALVHFSANRSDLERMGETGRKYVMERFDRDHLAREYLQVLLEKA
jgi:glycosyltransferase involved in cell wall biosynthesis